MANRLIKKICLLGDMSVGKTSLIKRYVFDTFSDEYITTIGTKTTKKVLDVNYLGKPTELTLMIWDILGQHEYRNLQKRSFVGTKGVIMVVDRTRPDTLNSITDYWAPELRKVAGEVPSVIVGNKSDLVDDLKVNPEQLKEVAEVFNTRAFLTSAKTGQNVETVFKTLGGALLASDSPGWSWTQKEMAPLSKAEVMDMIIDHFVENYGKDETIAMSVIRNQFDREGIDIKNPSVQDLIKLVNALFEVEKDVVSSEMATLNRAKRITFTRRLKD